MGITARNIAVYSLRGWTGYSSLAVNLAVGLNSLWDLPTILIDLTMVVGQVVLMLNTPLRRTWADVARFNSVEFDKEVLDSVINQHDSGLSFIAAPTFPAEAELISGETFSKALGLLRQQYEYIIADLPHDLSIIAVSALDEADIILMVISPDLASIRAAALDTYTRLNYPPEKIKVDLNATFPKHGISSDKIESALSAPITITIPYTPDKFVEAINSGLPIILNQSAEPITGLMEDFAFHMSKDQHKKIKPENPTDSWKRVYKRYNERKRK
jgi:pilus assembly protein CpaE